MSETPASWQVEPHGRGRYTLARADTRVRITWTRRGYRCSCRQRRCGHVAALEAWLEAQGDEEPPALGAQVCKQTASIDTTITP